MNMNEDYISNQIAVYKNSKTLLEFQDKLKVAPINSYAHIHAGGETGADGRRTHSLIGILMKDYSKGTGDKAVTVCANIAVPAGAGNENAVWVYPDQVCTVEYMPNTKNSLRQAVFKGFRTDMVPEDID